MIYQYCVWRGPMDNWWTSDTLLSIKTIRAADQTLDHIRIFQLLSEKLTKQGLSKKCKQMIYEFHNIRHLHNRFFECTGINPDWNLTLRRTQESQQKSNVQIFMREIIRSSKNEIFQDTSLMSPKKRHRKAHRPQDRQQKGTTLSKNDEVFTESTFKSQDLEK